MNSQNTPVHIRLWHHDFWRMATANLLLTMSVYMLLPILPLWLVESVSLNSEQIGMVMGAFGLGLYLFGSMTSYLVQRYRRNQVCIWAIMGMLACIAFLYYIHQYHQECSFSMMLVQRVAFGAFFGLAQMVLASTLIIDTSESFQRTEANHSASWFARFAMSLGPLSALVIYPLYGVSAVLLASGGCAFLATILILMVHFPFRAPDDNVSPFSCDRFFLTQGFILFVNLLMITLAIGMVMALALSLQFYSMMMVGFLMAIMAQRFVFREAELKSEVVTGLVLIGTALLLMITRSQAIVGFIAPLFIGLGLGIIGSRFLLFFIKLSRHCQRGTSQSTYTLGWESGIALGIGIGYALCNRDHQLVLECALGLIIASLLLYQYTHQWFLKHKNR